nr:hypothetical protein Iba_chr07eCG8910 [Ipomoea batatas]
METLAFNGIDMDSMRKCDCLEDLHSEIIKTFENQNTKENYQQAHKDVFLTLDHQEDGCYCSNVASCGGVLKDSWATMAVCPYDFCGILLHIVKVGWRDSGPSLGLAHERLKPRHEIGSG